MQKNNKTVLIDLDGVLNEYDGNFKEDIIPKIKDGARDFLKELKNKKYTLKLFTTRNKILASKWLIENKLEDFFEDVTNIKEACFLYVDDRCISFDGNYLELCKKIENYNPWYKR